MNVLLTGATGFVGRHLQRRLEESGHTVATVSRGSSGTHDWSEESLAAGVAAADAVIHLAGEPILGKRWSDAQKQRLLQSRVDTTSQLARLVAEHKPSVFLCASAIGWYAASDQQGLDESTPVGTGFLPELCAAWEAATEPARAAGVPTASVRVGIVMGADGGALQKMRVPFSLGLGGPLGNGRQWVSWIHVEDLVSLFVFLLEDPSRATGAYNGTAPHPVTSKDQARLLGRVLKRPAFLPVPALALKLMLGEVSGMLLTGQHVVPRRALDAGFTFAFPDFESAMRDLLT